MHLNGEFFWIYENTTTLYVMLNSDGFEYISKGNLESNDHYDRTLPYTFISPPFRLPVNFVPHFHYFELL